MPASNQRHKFAVLFCTALLAVATAAQAYMFNPENPPGLLAIGPDGNFYVVTGYWDTMRKVSPSGKVLAALSVKDFSSASYAVFDKAGDMYVVEQNEIVKFSPEGRKIIAFSAEQPKPGDLSGKAAPEPKQPYALAIDSKGFLYVSYLAAKVIDRFDPSGKYLGAFVTLPTAGHRGMAFDADGNLYVVNAKEGAIGKIAPDGKDLGPFIDSGLKRPTEIAFDAAGNLYVDDSPEESGSRHCVRKFSPDGKDLGVFAALTGSPDSKGFAIDHDGNIYVVSFWDGAVLKFSPQGRELGAFVTDGQAGHAW